VRTRRERGPLAGREATKEANPVGTLILGFWPPESQEDKLMLSRKEKEMWKNPFLKDLVPALAWKNIMEGAVSC
jgi:hypothetical protein